MLNKRSISLNDMQPSVCFTPQQSLTLPVVALPHTLPDSIRPKFTAHLREWYVAEYKDPLSIKPAILVQRLPGLGGHLPDPAYPVGGTGTAP